jgi:L-glutamine-phosphate cytidylyltransferase
MIALILAAGRGSRLGNFTRNIPKSLLPLNERGETLLDYNLNVLKNINVQHTFIVTGYESSQIEKVALMHEKTSVVYNPFWNYCNVLGSMYMALDKLDDDFFFLHADTLLEKEAWEKLAQIKEGDMILPYEAKPCGEEEMKIIVSQGRVTQISKTFDAQLASGEFVGIARFNKATVPYFKSTAEKLFKEGNLQHYMESVIQCSIDEGAHDILPLDISKYNFVEVDFEEDYIRAKKEFGNMLSIK